MQKIFIHFLLLLFFVTAASAAEPDREAISAHLAAALPGHLSLKEDWRSRTFPDSGGDSGRISVEGVLLLNEPLFSVNRTGPTYGLQMQSREVQGGLHWLIADAIERGVPQSQVLRIAKERQRISWLNTLVVEQLVPTGTELPFRAEVRYLETVSGFDLSGASQYTSLTGSLRRDLRNGLVRGDVNYTRLLDAIVAGWEMEQQNLENNVAAMEAFLALDGLTASFPLQTGSPPVPILLIAPIMPAWNEDNYRAAGGGEVRRRSFQYLAEAEIVSSVILAQTTYTPGQLIDVMITGSVIEESETLRSARLNMELVVNGSKMGLTDEMLWTGDHFARLKMSPDRGWQFAMRDSAKR